MTKLTVAFRNSVNALKNGLLRTPLSKPRHSVHLLISLYISVPHHSKARSTLQSLIYTPSSPSSSPSPIPSCPWPVWWLPYSSTCVLRLWENVNVRSYALSETYSTWGQKKGAFASPSRLLRNIGTQLFNHEAQTALFKDPVRTAQ